MSNNNNKEFVKITNRDIYEQIMKQHEENAKQHEAIIKRLDTTNGKVKLSKWIATTALTLSLLAIGWLLSNH